MVDYTAVPKVLGVTAMGKDELAIDCWDRAVLAFGTYYIFEQRSKLYRSRLRLLEYLGLALPGAVGCMVLSFNNYSKALPYILPIVGILAIIQFCGTLWSLVQRYNEGFSYSEQSMISNLRLSQNFEKLAKSVAASTSLLTSSESRYESLCLEDEELESSDEKQGLSDKERRQGMRFALRKFQRECAGCKIVPKDMRSTDCSVCGQF